MCIFSYPTSSDISGAGATGLDPATFRDGVPQPRRDFVKFCDLDGLKLIEPNQIGS